MTKKQESNTSRTNIHYNRNIRIWMKSSILFNLCFAHLCECQLSFTKESENKPTNDILNDRTDLQMNNKMILNENILRERESPFTINDEPVSSPLPKISISPSSVSSTSFQPTLYPSIPPNHHHHHHKHHNDRFIPKDVFQALIITVAIASLIIMMLAFAVHGGRIGLYFSGLWFQWGCNHKMERIRSICCFWTSDDDEADYDSVPPLNEVIFDYSDRSQIKESLLSD